VSTDIFQYDIALEKLNEAQFALCETFLAFTENLQSLWFIYAIL